jgi:serine phosphatase RsbU (regulator of sigma subunit)
MMPAKEIRGQKSPFLDRIRLLLDPRPLTPSHIDPLHSDIPTLRQAEIAAIYHGQRVAGDFYEFLRVSPSRVLFGLFDIAGRRDDTRQVLIAAQTTLRTLAPQLFAMQDVNESDAMIELSQQINRTILQFEGGVRSCPAFLGCYNEDISTVCYANAGHTPALLRDATGIARLEATGLPLGLFSHTTRDAYSVSLPPDAILLIVSRGIAEAECDDAEFGLEGVTATLQQTLAPTARDLCLTILRATQDFMGTAPAHNDVTALALVRARN